jgi:hypothetical protein
MVIHIQRGKERTDRKSGTPIPGTYQISIRRIEKSGEEEYFTCYVPTTPRGLKELLRLKFRGVPRLKKAQYFMKQNEYRKF